MIKQEVGIFHRYQQYLVMVSKSSISWEQMRRVKQNVRFNHQLNAELGRLGGIGEDTKPNIPSAPYVGKTNCFIKMAKHSLNCPSLSELGSIIRRFPRAKKRLLW